MPKKSENNRQQPEQPAEAETTPVPAAKTGRRSARKSAPAEEPAPGDAQPAKSPTAAPAASAGDQAPESALPASSENGKAAPVPLAGLRGEDYVKALSSYPCITVEVPLLPNERHGDWARARGQKIPVTTRQTGGQDGSATNRLEREHVLAALIIALQRPGATRFDQIDLRGRLLREAIERLSDYTNQARLHAQAQTGKKWTPSQVYLIPVEDA
jgi:hypothetical protein